LDYKISLGCSLEELESLTLCEFETFLDLASEFQKLKVHYDLTPPAMVTAMLYNVNRKKGAPAKEPGDFLKKLPKPNFSEKEDINEEVVKGLSLFCQFLKGV